MNWYVYIIRCSDSTFYCGATNNVTRRVNEHNKGRGAKYTKYRRPVRLLYFETFATKSEALKREYAVKQLTREEKDTLIRGIR
jgi:putative endonuclease